MKNTLEFLEHYGVEIALALSLVLAFGALAVRLCPSPVHRHRFVEWTLGLVLLAVPLLILPMPRLRSTPTQPVERRIVAGPTWNAHAPVEWQSAPPSLPNLSDQSSARPIPSIGAAYIEPSVAPEVPGQSNTHVWLGLGFLVGAIGFALHLVLCALLLARLARRSEAAPNWLMALAPEIASTRVLVSGETQRPFCYGLGSGTILLPANLVTVDQKRRLRAVLLHEQAHLDQRHGRARLIAAIAAPLLYWQPLFWWLTRSARQDAELVADDLASGSMDKRDYASELLGLVESAHNTALTATLGMGALGSRNHFLERMETLLMRTTPLKTRESRLQLATRTTLGLFLLTSVSLAWGRTPQTSEATPQETVTDETSSKPFLGSIPLLSDSFQDTTRNQDELVLLSDLFSAFVETPDDLLANKPSDPEQAPTPEVHIEFRLSHLGELHKFRRRIEEIGGQFLITSIKTLPGEGGRVIGNGCLLGLTEEQREPLSRFLNSGRLPIRDVPLATKPSKQVKKLQELDAEIRALTSRLAALRLERIELEDAVAREWAAGRANLANVATAEKTWLFQLAVQDQTQPSPEPAIQGQILAIEDRSGTFLVVINRGEEQGVKIGTTFDIYAGSTYKGRVEVTNVKPSMCVSTPLMVTQKMGVGDSATTDL